MSETTQTTDRAAKVVRLSSKDREYWRAKIGMLRGLTKGKSTLDAVTAIAGTLDELADEIERAMI